MMQQRVDDIIVLLPGIAGSVLSRGDRDVWAPSVDGVLGALWSLGRSVQSLALEADPINKDDLGDGVVATRLVPDLHIIPGLWGVDGYSTISAMIRSTFSVVPGRTYVEFPYDWRRDNRVSARRLAETVLPLLHEQRKQYPDARLVLIGHSMGGLVARYFLECLDGWKDTRLLVTFGTPFRGSLKALDFLVNGFPVKLGPLKIADLSKFLQSCTSVYQLLPIYPCIAGDVSLGSEHPFARVTAVENLPNLDVQRARRAEHDFHRVIESAVATRSVENPYGIHPVVGIVQRTPQSAQWSDGIFTVLDSYGEEDHAGDGTVPRVSATPLEFDDRTVDPCIYSAERHASLQNALAVQTQLLGVLTRAPRPERFRDTRSGLRLDLPELAAAGEDIPLVVTSGVRRLDLVAVIEDAGTRRPVAGPIVLSRAEDELRHELVLPPLSVGDYRVTVAAVGTESSRVQSVHGLMLVTDDTKPDET